jgi:hypothetical protein
MAHSKSNLQKVNSIYMRLSIIVSVLLLIIGGLALWASMFTSNMVRTELAAQKVYFPEKDSKALDPAVYPDLQQYAGQLVDTPEEAKAYANSYIGRHLAKVADGKVYSEVSAEAQKDPTNEKLQKQKQTLFQGETLRGLLLGTGYAFGTVGKIAGFAAYVMFVSSGALLLLAGLLRRNL